MTSTATAQATDATRRLEFAGHTWRVKAGDGLIGPGPNHFSADPRDAWVDDQGHLHLSIHHRDGRWLATELISDMPVGYGTYEFRLAEGIDRFDPNVVLGLFTWDSDSWQTDANSEIDIELTRWCEADAPNLHYSVHPAWGPDGKHPERYEARTIDLQGQPSTHVITWRPDSVECATYLGSDGPDPDKQVCRWPFDHTNPPRVTADTDGNTTDPIVIPKPHATTTIRLNLWLVDADRNGQADPPTDNQPVEVIVTDFTYTPADPTRPSE